MDFSAERPTGHKTSLLPLEWTLGLRTRHGIWAALAVITWPPSRAWRREDREVSKPAWPQWAGLSQGQSVTVTWNPRDMLQDGVSVTVWCLEPWETLFIVYVSKLFLYSLPSGKVCTRTYTHTHMHTHTHAHTRTCTRLIKDQHNHCLHRFWRGN